MKKLLIVVLCLLIISSCFYLAGAFMNATLHLKHWEKIHREILATFWLICVSISVVLILSLSNEEIKRL